MGTLKKTKNWFSILILLNAGQKYCRMLQGEHSAKLLTFIKLPFVIKIFVLSIFSGRFTQVLLYETIMILKFSKSLRTKIKLLKQKYSICGIMQTK